MAMIKKDYENGQHRTTLRVFTQVQCGLVTFYSFCSSIKNLYVEMGVKNHAVSG